MTTWKRVVYLAVLTALKMAGRLAVWMAVKSVPWKALPMVAYLALLMAAQMVEHLAEWTAVRMVPRKA